MEGPLKATRYSPVVLKEQEDMDTLRKGIKEIGPCDNEHASFLYRQLLVKVYPQLGAGFKEIGLDY